MARRQTSSNSRRSRKRGSGSSSSKSLIIIVVACAVIAIGVIAWLLLKDPGYQFKRADLEKYVEATHEINQLGNSASVYVDMSDGMNFAYNTPDSKTILQGIINKLAAKEAVNFYGLADSKIFPLEKSHTELYNYMLDPQSYNKQKAPIEEALKEILAKNQPALLMTDYEEYKSGVIEKAAYAKKYFIEWLAKGYNIVFYKWNFSENGKNKIMFLTVFDDNSNRMRSLVENAIALTNQSIPKYVLGSRDFEYPTLRNYPSPKQGGNYHNSKGVDGVTAVLENGGAEDYISFAQPYADAVGTQGQYAPLNMSIGAFAEYYPIGVKWSDAINNAKQMQEEGVPSEDRYIHLLSNVAIDFGAQDGFSINNIEVRTFDMQETMKTISNVGTIDLSAVENIATPEVTLILKASMEEPADFPIGWKMIAVDFDERFNGSFIGGVSSTDLIKANIVISQATPKVAEAQAFFFWEGNPSLADSVKETLTAASSSPIGRVLYTYYLRTLAE